MTDAYVLSQLGIRNDHIIRFLKSPFPRHSLYSLQKSILTGK